MRVADHGVLWKEIRVTCPKCRCDFLYRPKDLLKHVFYNFETKTGEANIYIPCPECGEHYIHEDPFSKRVYSDLISQDDIKEVIYDSGDLDDFTNTVIYDGGDIDDRELNYDGGDDDL